MPADPSKTAGSLYKVITGKLFWLKSESKVTKLKSLEADAMAKPKIQTLIIPDDGRFPNNDTLSLILVQQAFDPTTKNLVGTIEEAFHGNAWRGSWRNGIFTFHHYHSTAHEVLGLYAPPLKYESPRPLTTFAVSFSCSQLSMAQGPAIMVICSFFIRL